MEAINSSSTGHLPDEDSWMCHHCGWVYPNPHPSAKHRRNHKKHCGKLQSFQGQLLIAEGSSDEASDDDEGPLVKNPGSTQPVVILPDQHHSSVESDIGQLDFIGEAASGEVVLFPREIVAEESNNIHEVEKRSSNVQDLVETRILPNDILQNADLVPGTVEVERPLPLSNVSVHEVLSTEQTGGCNTEDYLIQPIVMDLSFEEMHTRSPKNDMETAEHGRGFGKEIPNSELIGSDTLLLHKLSNDSIQIDDTSSPSLLPIDGYQILSDNVNKDVQTVSVTCGTLVPNAAINDTETGKTCVAGSSFEADFDDSTGENIKKSQSVILLESSNLASNNASPESEIYSGNLPESNLVSNDAASESALGEKEERCSTTLSNKEFWRIEDVAHSSPECKATVETLSKKQDDALEDESAQPVGQQNVFKSVCELSSDSEIAPKLPVVAEVILSQFPQEGILNSSPQVVHPNSLETESVLEERMLGKNPSAIASESLIQHIKMHGISSTGATLSENESENLQRGAEVEHERLEERFPQHINGKPVNEYEHQVLGKNQSAIASDFLVRHTTMHGSNSTDAVLSEKRVLKHGSKEEHEKFKGVFPELINEALDYENESAMHNTMMADMGALNLETTEKELDRGRTKENFPKTFKESQNHEGQIVEPIGLVQSISQNDNGFNSFITQGSLFVEVDAHNGKPMIEANKDEKSEDNLYAQPGVGVNVEDLDSGSSAVLEGSNQEYLKAVIAETADSTDEMETFVDAPENLETCSIGASVDDNESLDEMRRSTSEKMDFFLNAHGSETDFNEQAYEEAFDLAPDAEGDAKTAEEDFIKGYGGYFTSLADGGEKEATIGSGSSYADIQAADKRSNMPPAFAEDLKAPSPEAWQEMETSEVGEARPKQTGQDLIPECSSSEPKPVQIAKKLQKLHTPLRSLLTEEAEKIESEQRISASNKQDVTKPIGEWGSPPSMGKSKPRSFWSHCICCPAVH